MNKDSRLSTSARCWLMSTLTVIVSAVGCSSDPAVSVANLTQVPMAAVNAPQAKSKEVEPNNEFAHWVTSFIAFARLSGIDEQTLSVAFKDARYIERVIESDRAQPEFSRAIWDYLDIAVSKQRISRGQQQLMQQRSEIDGVAKRYGVAVEVLAAIWGMESNYGSFVGDIPTIDALATLGFDGRREGWARTQLMAALQILQGRDVDPAQMVGSWAGAMGQTQLLPSNFLAYAVDADGDGRRDLWGSLPDVMASTANFLSKSGWQTGQPVAIEVRLPQGFDYARADEQVRQASQAWGQAGVQTVDGKQLPDLPDSSILLPSNFSGPAFLVGANFRTILRYNNAVSYALAVSLLAQQLAGGPGVQAPWPRDLIPLSRSQILAMQTALNNRGFDCGTPDGIIGPATRRGIRHYQVSLALPADGYPTLGLLQRLQ